MNTLPVVTPPVGLDLGDIYFTIFRHKWKIILCSSLGIAAAFATYRLDAPLFQSEAKLFVRYIISENKTLGPTSNDTTAKSPDQRGETIMKSEAEILSSLDIAKQVAEAIGSEKLLEKTGGGNDLNAAISLIKSNLSVNIAPSSSVISVIFRHPDSQLVQPVLRELIERYRKLHVETHTANGILGDFLAQETDQLRSRLSQTEDELRKATTKAGVISIEDAKRGYGEQLTAIRRELMNAQAELAERIAVQAELSKRLAKSAEGDNSDALIPAEILANHKNATHRIETLQRAEQEMLVQFTPESARVRELRAQIAEATAERNKLEQEHPQLIVTVFASRNSSEPNPIDPLIVATQITALQAKVKALTAQLDDVRREVGKLDLMEGAIVELRRKKELEDANYRYYSASLEQSRINETLGDGRISNISRIQAPSPPFSDRSRSNKVALMILAGGFVSGILWAFLVESYFDRSIKRAVDVERTLRVPLFIAIPAVSRKRLNGSALLLRGAGEARRQDNCGSNGNHQGKLVANEATNPLQPFHETLRDRLIAYFESINLTHKPKLVAVTGLAENAGVTTTAAGLARSLSETGEGNVLLVDMNVGQGMAQQFMNGNAVCGLDQMFDARDSAHVNENLYVVAENNHSDRLSRNMPQRFSKLVPKLKASDFDYIIFDMPAVSQISITPRLASFMDMVLLVVESEKSPSELVQRAANLLNESRTHVGVVLNKTRSYVPSYLYQDSLSSS